MNKVNFIFFFTLLLSGMSCHSQSSDEASASDKEKAVNLADSEGCGSEKSEGDSDEISFAQSSKLDSESSEKEIFEENEKSDSGCTL